MQFASASSAETTLDEALTTITNDIQQQLDNQSIDLALVFITEPWVGQAEVISKTLREKLAPGLFLGCSAESVIGNKTEIEFEHGIACLAAHLPDVTLKPFQWNIGAWQDILVDKAHLGGVYSVDEATEATILLADPYSTPINQLLNALNSYFPEIPIIGGMASAATAPNGNVLFFDEEIIPGGAVGVVLSGNIQVDMIVSQGCRPLGDVHTIEEIEENVIIRMDNSSPLLHLQKLVDNLPPSAHHLLRNGIFIGRAIQSDNDDLGRGDFLVRGVLGVDHEYGAIAVGDYMDVGERVQFHVRDASTAIEDLSLMLTPQSMFGAPAGIFVVSCNSRGTRLFDHPNGDVSTITNTLGSVKMAGFFAAGELGPIGDQNFLHGHTASLALFRPRQTSDTEGA